MKRVLAWALAGVATLLLCAGAGAQSAAPVAERFAVDLREEIVRIPVTVNNAYGIEASGQIAITTFRPAGDGPFPLAVMSHGRAVAEMRAQQGRQRYEPLARYLVSKGFAVFVPTRLGYGDTYGQADPEDGGSCAAMQPESMSLAASDQVLATVAYARGLPWVDATRWVALGQSVGGMATVALAWRKPQGLVAAINFAGGAGGNPQTRPGKPCSPQSIEKLWRAHAREAEVDMLWLYWRNDLYWGEEWPQRWAKAWTDGGGRVEFHQLDAVGKDGHSGSTIDMDHWVPIVEDHLARAGFGRTGLVARPAASGFAPVADVDKLPAGPNGRDAYASKFLAAKAPRAFAVGPGGVFAWSVGDWALGRALGLCQATRGVLCKLYAVDDDVVWVP